MIPRYSKARTMLISILLLLSQSLFSQDYKPLERISAHQTIPEGQAIIYGSFIQRLGFSSGGFQQEMQLINIDTEERYTMTVKAAMSSAKETPFLYFIKAGRYAILNYLWIQSKWYGGKVFIEPVVKQDQAEPFTAAGDSTMQQVPTRRFVFEIKPGEVHYLGTWHFHTKEVTFTANKEAVDKKLLKATRKNFDFEHAQTVLPK